MRAPAPAAQQLGFSSSLGVCHHFHRREALQQRRGPQHNLQVPQHARPGTRCLARTALCTQNHQQDLVWSWATGLQPDVQPAAASANELRVSAAKLHLHCMAQLQALRSAGSRSLWTAEPLTPTCFPYTAGPQRADAPEEGGDSRQARGGLGVQRNLLWRAIQKHFGKLKIVRFSGIGCSGANLEHTEC